MYDCKVNSGLIVPTVVQRLGELVTDWALAVLKKPQVLQLPFLPNWKSDTLSFCQAARAEPSDKSFQLPEKWREDRMSQTGGAGIHPRLTLKPPSRTVWNGPSLPDSLVEEKPQILHA